MFTDSRIEQNIRYLSYKCGFYIQDLIKLTCNDIINGARMKEENVRVAQQVDKLVFVRQVEWMNCC